MAMTEMWWRPRFRLPLSSYFALQQHDNGRGAAASDAAERDQLLDDQRQPRLTHVHTTSTIHCMWSADSLTLKTTPVRFAH
jgi:hypothetical protein